jgi:hypothetical protein
MEHIASSSPKKGLFSGKSFLYSLINELLFYVYIYFINAIVLSKVIDVEIINHEGNREVIQNMLTSELGLFLLIATLLEIVAFVKIPATPAQKGAILVITGIPRLFLLWEISRILMISFTQKITTGGSILLFFMVPVILLIILGFFMSKEMFSKRGEKIPPPKPVPAYHFLLILPLYCLWYTLFEQVYLFDYGNSDWFVFAGLYSVFMYFPLKLPYIIPQIGNRSLSKWYIAFLVLQPFIVYFMVYKNITS